MGKDQTRTGVRWVLKANPKDISSVPPNIMVGVLLARQTDGPFVARFDIQVNGGLLHDLQKRIERLLGRKPDQTKPY
jgi:hypothetical protein